MSHQMSHDLAEAMIETANFLLQRPNFETLLSEHSLYFGNAWCDDDKPKFLGMVRALGSVTKTFSGSELEIATATPLRLWARINRDKVCRKVQEEKWEDWSEDLAAKADFLNDVAKERGLK